MVNMKKPDLYDLIALNVMGRGVLVDNREDADIVFDTALYLNNDTVENKRDKMVITPYDTELFMSEYL